ncbi:MAG: SRPBCC family protein [Candidatus Limnocylindrales bacterium]
MYVDISVAIHSPLEDVFALLADIQEHIHTPGSPIPEMEKIPPEPTRVGTRWREVVRLAPFLTMTVVTRVVACDPPRRLASVFREPGMRGQIEYLLEPHEDGTLLRQRELIRARGLARPFETCSRGCRSLGSCSGCRRSGSCWRSHRRPPGIEPATGTPGSAPA